MSAIVQLVHFVCPNGVWSKNGTRTARFIKFTISLWQNFAAQLFPCLSISATLGVQYSYVHDLHVSCKIVAIVRTLYISFVCFSNLPTPVYNASGRPRERPTTLKTIRNVFVYISRVPLFITIAYWIARVAFHLLQSNFCKTSAVPTSFGK